MTWKNTEELAELFFVAKRRHPQAQAPAQTAYRRMNDKLVVADFKIEIKLI
jgi:hypothetical protein